MSGAQPVLFNALKALKTLGFWRQTAGRSCSAFGNFRFYSSGNARDGIDKPEVITTTLEDETVPEAPGNEGEVLLAPVDPSAPTNCESITDRLRRLSQSSPEDFVPTAGAGEAMDKAKERYRETVNQYKQRFAQQDRQRYGNPNYRGRGGGEDPWGDKQNRRWFSTTSAAFSEQGNGIIDRLRRLSVSSEENFKPSEGAKKIRETGEARQRSQGNYDNEQFDQRRVRPSNYGRQTQGYGNNGGGRGYKRNANQNMRNSWSDGEDEIENETQRDPTTDPRLTPFFQKDRPAYRSSNYRDQNQRRPREDSGGSSSYGDFQSRPREDAARSSNYGDRPSMSSYGDFQRRPRDSGNAWKKYYGKEEDTTTEKGRASEEGSSLSAISRGKYQQRENTQRPDGHVEDKSIRRPHGIDKIQTRPMVSSSSEARSDIFRKKRWEDADLDLTAVHGDPDTFGTLSLGSSPITDAVGTAVKKELLEDEKELGLSEMDDEEEDDVRFSPAEKWSMKKLVKQVKALVDEKKVKEAVDTLVGALAQGGFQFDKGEIGYCYNLCISSCAQVGYVEMAFKLFNDMKKRGYPHKQSTYTSLFNACANSPWESEKNIERMNRLRENMLEKGVALNQINYHSMIKGYGRCGDLETAFSIVDEMITHQQIQPTTETFNMLLQACITIKTNGFRHVLVTWRKMQSMRIRPDIYSFNLLLRAVRECGIQLQLSEEESEFSDELEVKKSHKSDAPLMGGSIPRLPPVVTDEESNDMLNLICLNDATNALANINTEGKVACTYEDVIRALALPENRLAILGGLRGIMSQMSVDKVGPNMKTVNELAQLIYPNESSDLLMLMKTYKLKPNIDFFNLLIKRCYFLMQEKQAENLMNLLPEYNLTPNIMTWGVAATGCKNWYSAKHLLEEMDAAEFMPNIEIMGALSSNACNNFDPKYVLRMMEEMKHREVTPDAKFILQIDQFRQTVKKGQISQEMGKPIEPQKLKTALENWDEESWTKFCLRYKNWIASTEIKVEPENPWTEDFDTFRKHRRHNSIHDPEEEASSASAKSS